MSLNKESVKKEVDRISPELKELAIKIHDHPEIGYEEHFACEQHTDILRKHGFEVEKGIIGFPTAFRATFKSGKPGPVIAFLAEYDALPDLGHGCGHNLVGAVSTGAGIASIPIAKEFGGEIRVYGTPAEENGASKADMTNKGIFKDCDVALMAHPAYANADNFNTIALRTMIIEFFGRTSHASGSPENGINALDAMINMFNMLNAMRQETRPDTRIHGIIADGGKAPNIIPDYTKAIFYIRANDKEYCSELYERFENIVKGAALGTGCTYKISKYHETLDDSKYNAALADLASTNMESLGMKVMRTKGAKMAASSDIGNVSQVIPALQMLFCIGKPDTGKINEGHTTGIVRDSASETGLDAMIDTTKTLAMTAYDILSEPDNLKRINEDFSR